MKMALNKTLKAKKKKITKSKWTSHIFGTLYVYIVHYGLALYESRHEILLAFSLSSKIGFRVSKG